MAKMFNVVLVGKAVGDRVVKLLELCLLEVDAVLCAQLENLHGAGTVRGGE
jgi:hypothetical protein